MFKIINFYVKIVKIYQCVKQLMIPQSIKLLFNNYTINVATKGEKVLLNGQQTNTGGITCIQISRNMYSHMKNTNSVTLPILMIYCIQNSYLFYGKNWALILFIYPFIKVINFRLLYIIIYLVVLKQNPYVFFFLKLLQIFFQKMLFIDMVVLGN